MAAVTVVPGAPRPAVGPGPAEGADALFVALSAGFTALSHPLLYVKLLVQVGHEPLPPTVGRNLLGSKVLYLPGFFTYGTLWKWMGKGVFSVVLVLVFSLALYPP